jgi:sugar-specific transcriptional regulator TrmB
LSLKRILETLTSFGLKQSDAKVYVFLAKKGPHTEADLSDALNMPKNQTYQCLRNLEDKGIVTATRDRPALFSALPFEKVLDLLVKAKLEEARRTEQNTYEALCNWKSMLKENHTHQ